MPDSQSGIDRFFETVHQRQVPGDPYYFEDCNPDLHFPSFGDIDTDQLAELEAPHVLLDFDGTLIPSHGVSRTVPEPTADKLAELTNDPRFETVSLATENGAYPERLLEILGLHPATRVFQVYDLGPRLGPAHKATASFWRKIMFDLDCWDTPERLVMIGNHMHRDVAVPQEHGLRAVLVDTAFRVLSQEARDFIRSD